MKATPPTPLCQFLSNFTHLLCMMCRSARRQKHYVLLVTMAMDSNFEIIKKNTKAYLVFELHSCNFISKDTMLKCTIYLIKMTRSNNRLPWQQIQILRLSRKTHISYQNFEFESCNFISKDRMLKCTIYLIKMTKSNNRLPWQHNFQCYHGKCLICYIIYCLCYNYVYM